MAWGPDGRAVAAPDTGPGAFALADVDDAAARVALVIRQVRPHVVVMYEPGGGYGHPDHVQAHRVAMRAVELAEVPGPGGDRWVVPKVYWNVVAGGDEPVTTVVDGTAYLSAKSAAMRAHATQISVWVEDGQSFFALSNGIRQPLVVQESYRLVRGVPGGPKDADGRETDLLADLS
jgi:N-acetyl-1-D-myo-inositol-2-amino-2-deoxy-alpha-D-glucopyranoside deacetylase